MSILINEKNGCSTINLGHDIISDPKSNINLDGNDITIIIGNNVYYRSQSRIEIIGNNNTLHIEDDVRLVSVNLRLKGNNIKLHIRKNAELTGVILSMFTNCAFSIGEYTTLGNGEVTIAESTFVNIGKDCMFAHGYEIRTSDMHPIYSLSNGERLNFGKSISIGDHVWIGRNVSILKGVMLADNLVIGMNSLVAKSIFQKNCIALGAPATVIKKGIVWGRKMYHKTMYDDPTLAPYLLSTNNDKV